MLREYLQTAQDVLEVSLINKLTDTTEGEGEREEEAEKQQTPGLKYLR